MSAPKPPDDPRQIFTVEYDGIEGRVIVNDFGVQEVIEIRSGLVEKVVRYAAIVELEKLGYTVISPEEESS